MAAVISAAVSLPMSAAAMSFMMMLSMMAAYRIRIVIQSSRQELLHFLVRIAGTPRIQINPGLGKRCSGAAADTAANQHIHSAAQQKSRKSAVSLAVGIHDLRRHNLTILYMIHFKLLRMPKMLEHLSVFIRYCNFHLNILSFFIFQICWEKPTIPNAPGPP